MAELLQSNRMALRHCILYDFLGKIPVFESYGNMCKRIGENAMEYLEFEFWYTRFAKGCFDLNYDWSFKPKAPSLSDIPVDILEKIVNELDFINRPKIRKISKAFQILFDNWNPGFGSIRISIYNKRTVLSFDQDRHVNYYIKQPYRDSNNVSVVHIKKKKKEFEKVDHWELAIGDLLIAVKCPKLKLEELSVSGSSERFFKELESKFKTLNRKICVKCFSIFSKFDDSEMSFLPYLEAGSLKKIIWKLETEVTQERINRVVETEQFKAAECFEFNIVNHLNFFPIESLSHCKRLEISVTGWFDDETIVRFIKALLQFPNLESFQLSSKLLIDVDFVETELDSIVTHHPYRSDLIYFPIPVKNSEIVVSRNNISFELDV